MLSDLHLGPDAPGASFREGTALAALLHRRGEPREAATELVLAGDLFDFLWLDGYQGFDAKASLDRFEALLANPQAQEVLSAVRRFAGRPGNETTLLCGNHDPELLLPEVRARFEERVGRRGSVFYGDDEPLWPAEGEHPAVFGRALGLAESPVWVVHGDRWDPVNFVDRPQVRKAAAEGARVDLPMGSHLVFEVLRQLKPRFPWIDQLKPEFPAVLALLLYLDPHATAGFLRQHLGLSARVLRDTVRTRLRQGALFEQPPGTEPVPHSAPGQPQAPEQMLAGLLAGALAAEPAERHELLLAELDRRMSGGAPAGPGTLADHWGYRRFLLRSWLEKAREHDQTSALDAPDGIPEAARRVLPPELAALVVGHTHGPRAFPADRPAYFNTGTWLPVMGVPQGELETLIDQIEAGPGWPAPSPRTFAEVSWGSGPPRVRLMKSDERGNPSEVGAR